MVRCRQIALCCGIVVLAALARFASGPLKWVLLYTFAELVHDGIPWRSALSDVNYILDQKFKSHPWYGYFSRDRLYVLESDDHATAICKAAMFLKITEVPGYAPLIDTADPVRTLERLEAFVDACTAVHAELPEAQREVLAGFRPPPGIPAELEGATRPRMHGPAPGDEDFLRRRAEAAAARPGEAQGRARPARPEAVPASEVARCIWEGRVATFDATELLPREVFNITIGDIARMHGQRAKDIPIYRQHSIAALRSGWESLGAFAHRLEAMKRAGKLYYPNVAPKARDPEWRPPVPSSWWLRWVHSLVRTILSIPEESIYAPERVAHELRRELYMTTVNSRRLPELPIDMEKALGSPEWLARAQPLLWSGAVSAWWHNDEPDNLLIALNGEMNVAVFEASDTDLISGSRGPISKDRYFDLDGFHPDEPDSEWVRNNPWIEKFPYIHVKLKPGMGIVVPSRAYHAIWSEDADRLLLNSFMFPKYKAMEQSPASNFSFFGRGMQPDIYMALFHLKMASIARLWETRRLGGFFEMVKLESL